MRALIAALFATEAPTRFRAVTIDEPRHIVLGAPSRRNRTIAASPPTFSPRISEVGVCQSAVVTLALRFAVRLRACPPAAGMT